MIGPSKDVGSVIGNLFSDDLESFENNVIRRVSLTAKDPDEFTLLHEHVSARIHNSVR